MYGVLHIEIGESIKLTSLCLYVQYNCGIHQL